MGDLLASFRCKSTTIRLSRRVEADLLLFGRIRAFQFEELVTGVGLSEKPTPLTVWMRLAA
jgi:hypothetical protein